MTSERTKTQEEFRTYKHIEHNPGERKQVRSNQGTLQEQENKETQGGQGKNKEQWVQNPDNKSYIRYHLECLLLF